VHKYAADSAAIEEVDVAAITVTVKVDIARYPLRCR